MNRTARFVRRGVGRARAAVAGRPLRALAGATLAGGAFILYFGLLRHQLKAAEVELSNSRPNEARRHLALALRLWPWGADAHRLAGRAARMAGDLPAAESHLNRALRLNGRATEAVQLEFLLLRAQSGDLDQVAPTLSDAVDRGHPESPLILETVAQAYMVQLRYQPAYLCLSQWIELCPGAARAYQWRGWVTERLNNPKQAAADYQKAVELEPNAVPARLRLAELYLEDRRAPEALAHLQRLAELAPDDPHIRSRLGICHLLRGEPAEARRLMEPAAAELPGDPTLLIHLARLELEEGRYARAEQWLKAVFAADPSDNEARFTLVSVYQLQGRTEDAARALEEYTRYKAQVERVNALLKDVVDRPTARPDDYADVAELLLAMGRAEVARYWLDRALQADPAHERSHRAMAAYYDKQGNAEAAGAHRRQARRP